MAKFSTFAVTQITTASDQSGISLAPGGELTTPTVSGPTSGNELSQATFTITNYNAAQTYIVAITGGSVSRSGSTITWTLPAVSSTTTHYLNVQSAFGAQTSDVVVKQISVTNINIADNAVFVSEFSSNTSSVGWAT